MNSFVGLYFQWVYERPHPKSSNSSTIQNISNYKLYKINDGSIQWGWAWWLLLCFFGFNFQTMVTTCRSKEGSISSAVFFSNSVLMRSRTWWRKYRNNAIQLRLSSSYHLQQKLITVEYRSILTLPFKHEDTIDISPRWFMSTNLWAHSTTTVNSCTWNVILWTLMHATHALVGAILQSSLDFCIGVLAQSTMEKYKW